MSRFQSLIANLSNLPQIELTEEQSARIKEFMILEAPKLTFVRSYHFGRITGKTLTAQQWKREYLGEFNDEPEETEIRGDLSKISLSKWKLGTKNE